MKRKIIIEHYKITRNKVTHMKLTSLTLSENETLSMYNRYRFDEENTKRMIDDSQRMSKEYDDAKRQREYAERDFDAIYERLSRMSKWELIKELFR